MATINTKAAGLVLPLRVRGLVGLSGPTITASSDDGKWSITFPRDFFPHAVPESILITTLGVVMNELNEIEPLLLDQLKGMN